MDDGAVLLDLESGVYFGLDEVGTRVWTLLVEQRHARRRVRGDAREEFDVEPGVLADDVRRLVGELQQNGLAPHGECSGGGPRRWPDASAGHRFRVGVLAESAVLAVGVEAALRLRAARARARAVRAVTTPPDAPNPDPRAAGAPRAPGRWPLAGAAAAGEPACGSRSCRWRCCAAGACRPRCASASGAAPATLEFHAWADCDGPIDDRRPRRGLRPFEPVPATAISRSARWSRPAAPPDVAV